MWADVGSLITDAGNGRKGLLEVFFLIVNENGNCDYVVLPSHEQASGTNALIVVSLLGFSVDSLLSVFIDSVYRPVQALGR